MNGPRKDIDRVFLRTARQSLDKAIRNRPPRAPKSPSDMTNDELNAAIAREVMGWLEPDEEDDTTWAESIRGHWFQVEGGPRSWATDIGVAMNDVVEEMMRRRELDFDISRGHPKWEEWFVQFTDFPTANAIVVHARNTSLPRAICEAALAAVRSEG